MTRVLTSTFALFLTACAPEAGLDGPDVSAVKAVKEDICHVDEYTGEWHPISVALSSVDSHLDNHGDWLVEEELCSDGIDNDCDGFVDEDCCPCGDTWDGLMEFASTYVDEAVCWYSEEGFEPAEWTDAVAIEGYGYDADGFFGQIYTVDWGENNEGFVGDYACAYYYEYVDVDGNYVWDFGSAEINEYDHAACKVEIYDWAEILGLECIDATP